jgi:RHS repeat-associated protein
VQNTYNNGYLTGVVGYTGGSGITYYPNGMVSSVTARNGVTTTYGADPFGLSRPSSITAVGPGGTLWTSGTYTYDGAGNVTQIGHGYYTYDAVSRIANAQVQTNQVDGVGTTFVTQSFAYDAFGNNVETFGGIDQGTNTATNHLNYGGYDAAGNLRTWSPPGQNTATYDFDELGHLKHYKNGTQEWLYMYDADDERTWSFQLSGTGTPPRFDRWTLRGLDGSVRRTFEISGYNWNATSPGWSSTNSWEDEIYRGGVLLAGYPSAAQRRTASVDHLGTPRLITNGSGLQAAFHAYLPYGEEATSVGQDCTTVPCERMKFTARERDLGDPSTDKDDLDYMHARHYSFLTGRFLAVDRHQGIPKVPQSWNRYLYTRGNPLRLVDRDGREALTFQITTFIQQPVVASPPAGWPPVALYNGGMKTTQTFTIQTDPKKAADPVIDYAKDTGRTVRMDTSGNPVERGKAEIDTIVLMAGRDSKGNAQVIAGAASTNPLEPSPPIMYSLLVSPDQAGTSFTYSLYFGGFPSIDITATNEEGQMVTVFHSDESTNLFGPVLLFCGPLGCGDSESGTVSFGMHSH